MGSMSSEISTNFSGCVNWHGVGCGSFINSSKDGETYINVKGDVYKETLEDYQLDLDKVTLFQENCSVHRITAVKKCYEENNIREHFCYAAKSHESILLIKGAVSFTL
ncbi:expressed protein [Dictyostelium purpureum]|uniref:Expressed protein n=1 Tax=Dictyostelium purpureum TaxID=5786 RepID=F0ZFE7_DICPU|nr:uncharacterized protein DICPUDRAFT_150083 [Dictyostelium purpureum]EGC37321.1 expressed protein [Dictyostelium purpureum]|eukprot:XP_003286135.1 expressed protein [Dictyostelium purpureum]